MAITGRVGVEDDRGVRWTVMPHDPASQLYNELKRKGYRWVVLPRYTLRTGLIPESIPDCDDFIRSVRLEDCVVEVSK